MAYEKFGSDQSQIAGFGGAMQSEDGTVLVSDNSLGETALMMGPALNREVLAGVSNGDFAIGPQDPLATITDANPLPYWSFTDTSSAGAITAAIVADTGSASGNALRFTVASGTTTGKAAQISRYFPIPSSRSRALWHGLEISFAPGFTSTNNARISAQIDFYANDQATQIIPALASTPTLASRTLTTATITMNGLDHLINIGDTVTVALTSGPTGYAALNGTYVVTAVPSATTFQYTTATSGTITSGAASGTVTVSTKVTSTFALLPTAYTDNSIQIPDYTQGGARVRAATAPANAAFARVVIIIDTVGTVSPAATLDLNEIRAIRGSQELVLNDSIDPKTYSPAIMQQFNGSLDIKVGDTTSGGSIPTIINLQKGIATGSGGTISLSAEDVYVGKNYGTDGNIYANSIAAGFYAASKLYLSATDQDVVVQDNNSANGTNPRILMRAYNGTYYAGIKSGAAGVVQILSGSATTTYGQLWAARIYPMNGSTASRYIFDTGTQTGFSGPILCGAITSTGTVNANDYTADTITGTTATTNAAIWVLTAGTTYSLRRNTSSARYKTNIVDADEAVLEAARKIRPRHYQSTIEEEAGATRLGFIAEEVEAAGLTHAVGHDAEGRVDTIDPTALIAALYARVNDLEERLKALESR